MTTDPAPDARPRSLHRRLTVALASAVDRARLAQVLGGDLPAVGTPGGAPLIRSEDLWMAADGFAQLRAADRAEERSRLDAIAARITHDHETASSQLESLSTWRRTLLDGATWATDTETALVEHHAAVDAARARLDDRQHEQRAAHQNLQRVLEQRHAAADAIEEADRELGDVSGLGMDESGLRRELEAAGRAVQEAEEAHRIAVAELDQRRDEQVALLARRQELDADTPVPASTGPVLDGAVEAVVEAVQALRTVSSGFDDVDPQAVALADAWRDLSADLAQLAPIESAPSETDRAAAVDRVTAAAAALAEVDAAAKALTPEDREALDAAHTELLEAEERVGRRMGAAAARKRLDQARDAERALLDRYGFPGYIDVVLTGGRSGAVDPRRPQLERAHFDALADLEALDLAAQGGQERAHLESERQRLHEHVVEVLGVDPGDRTLDLLKDHRQVPKELQRELITALEGVGVRPIGMSLQAAAEAFLESHGISIDDAPADAHWEAWPPLDLTEDAPTPADQAVEVAEIDARLGDLRATIEAAQSEVDRLAEELHLAQRSVVAFEGELSLRAGEDEARMQRHAAAEQLRTQIEAVGESLERAEQAARNEISRAEQNLVSAEGDYDQAAAAVTELARQARKLAEELPIDQRPEGEPLHTLRLLAERLRAHAEVLDPEVDRAEVAVATVSGQLQEALSAAHAASAGADGPMAEDLVAGLEEIFEREAPDTVLILDEPFVGVDHDVRLELLDTVLSAGVDRQIVLLTEDPEVLGWAIELPAEVASAMPADALLARIQRATKGSDVPPAPAPEALVDEDPVDITEPAYALAETAPSSAPDSDPDPAPEPTHDAPVARRWAGQR